jgi:hypothetical protein
MPMTLEDWLSMSMTSTSDKRKYQQRIARRKLEYQQRSTRLLQAMYDVTLRHHVRDPKPGDEQHESKDGCPCP